jgi:hypothetical protein
LSELGCRQQGRSRLWIADQRFWVIVIEFQPSGFSKGSYLNVGANWLWHGRASKYWSFDFGNRVAGFIKFENAVTFTPLAEQLAARAADEVHRLRDIFRTLPDIARQLASNAAAYSGWPAYHAAIAAGLVGDAATAQQLFQKAQQDLSDVIEWQAQLRQNCAALSAMLQDPVAYRRAIVDTIRQSRVMHGLPSDPAGTYGLPPLA